MRFELKKPYQHYTDAELIEDIRHVASVTGKPTVARGDYELHGRYGYQNTAKRFGSWIQALEKAGLNTDRAKPATAETLTDDLRRVATTLGRDYVSLAEYRELGKWSESPFFRVFGNWSKAMVAAGLRPHPNSRQRASDEDLLANFERVWTQLGRQPRHAEIKSPLSRFSVNTYLNRFGTWRKALEAFVAWVEAEESEGIDQPATELPTLPEAYTSVQANLARAKKRTTRIANLRLRFRVMRRDNFTCRACGRSPSLHPGLVLNIDHIIAWEAGSETVEENLQTLCEDCNQGKGILPWESERKSAEPQGQRTSDSECQPHFGADAAI